jgi:hypothetical protein
MSYRTNWNPVVCSLCKHEHNGGKCNKYVPSLCSRCNHEHTEKCDIKIKCHECDHVHDGKCTHVVETLDTGTYQETIREPHNVYRTESYDTVDKITKTRTVMKLTDVRKTRRASRFISVNHPKQEAVHLQIPCSRARQVSYGSGYGGTEYEYYTEYRTEYKTVDNYVSEVEYFDEPYSTKEMVPTEEKYVEEIPCVKERQVIDHVDYKERIVTKNNPRVDVYCNCENKYESACHCNIPTNKLCNCKVDSSKSDSIYDIDYPQTRESTYVPSYLRHWDNNHAWDSGHNGILGFFTIISITVALIGSILLFTVKKSDDTYNFYYTIMIIVPSYVALICLSLAYNKFIFITLITSTCLSVSAGGGVLFVYYTNSIYLYMIGLPLAIIIISSCFYCCYKKNESNGYVSIA